MIDYLLRFATVGVINTVIGYAVIFFCMYGLSQSPVLSNVIGYAVGLIVSFVLNRSYTFRSTAAVAPQALRFAAFFILAYLVNLGILIWLTRYLGVRSGTSQIVAGIAYFVVFFIISKYFVFAGGGRNDSRN
ncbi:GtrA family protein [Variovorax arabinosiphilus]|uniref:GtrA family protein n=1 Tax=Variovorax arabinosiphilus TaxID=3053498 RepID=UPI0025766F46|nr:MULTISPECIES: GtrA family protein [unclassified Variovorax]MDM0122284.1 GtrA family protein [Variovorax sp. J2L1-78]MDM0131187.1 GtrA family protein [Variovorax sp. J2L1-63]MDM0235047.1 GtrA family protein [Variovorax sp. J2R1-6]